MTTSSKREWKPGDVAMIEVGCHANRHVGWFDGAGWRYGSNKWAANDPSIVTARPLVVLDLKGEPFTVLSENLKARAEHMDAHGHVHTAAGLRDLIAQIEAQTRPPKPLEPTGLGAVVEDAEGKRWVRVVPRIGYFYWQSADTDHRAAKWQGVDAVRVLSEGVTA